MISVGELLSQRLRFGMAALAWFGLSACASDLVYHSFEFDAVRESPDITVMAYQYGNSKGPGMRDQEHEFTIEGKRFFGARQGTSSTGEILRPDFLYVQWRIKATGEVLEDTVDLKRRLPRDFSRHTVHFTVDGRQLFVYLISGEENRKENCREWKEKRLERKPLRVFRMYCDREIQQIYP